MKIALFGGTFDPVHSGHVRAAQAAARQFRLDRILWIPSGHPPHKVSDHLAPFAHRFAMVVLACSADPRFVPSLLEAPRPGGGPNFSISTARAVQRTLQTSDRLFSLLGVDAFLDLPHWKDHRRLLALADFIVVARPGFSCEALRNAIPPHLLRGERSPSGSRSIRLRRSTVHVLEGVDAPMASRDIREAVGGGRRVTGIVPPLVEQYILKEGLYRLARPGSTR